MTYRIFVREGLTVSTIMITKPVLRHSRTKVGVSKLRQFAI